MVGYVTLDHEIIRAKARLMCTLLADDFEAQLSEDPWRFTDDGLLLFVEAILREYEKERELARKFPSRRS